MVLGKKPKLPPRTTGPSLKYLLCLPTWFAFLLHHLHRTYTHPKSGLHLSSIIFFILPQTFKSPNSPRCQTKPLRNSFIITAQWEDFALINSKIHLINSLFGWIFYHSFPSIKITIQPVVVIFHNTSHAWMSDRPFLKRQAACIGLQKKKDPCPAVL